MQNFVVKLSHGRQCSFLFGRISRGLISGLASPNVAVKHPTALSFAAGIFGYGLAFLPRASAGISYNWCERNVDYVFVLQGQPARLSIHITMGIAV
jgi:hypothetical protein